MIVALLFSAALMADPAASGGGATSPAAVAPSSPPAAAPAKTAKADPDRVCKVESVLGSKITKKVCYSREQMAERTFYDKQHLDLIQNATPMNIH
jgi:hypothetical protein